MINMIEYAFYQTWWIWNPQSIAIFCILPIIVWSLSSIEEINYDLRRRFYLGLATSLASFFFIGLYFLIPLMTYLFLVFVWRGYDFLK